MTSSPMTIYSLPNVTRPSNDESRGGLVAPASWMQVPDGSPID
jgi:hypothetical protein